MEGYGAQDLAKAALLAIFGVVITFFFKKLMANYFMRSQQVPAETAGSATVQRPRLAIDLELSAVSPECN
jgi:hypothetical protein